MKTPAVYVFFSNGDCMKGVSNLEISDDDIQW